MNSLVYLAHCMVAGFFLINSQLILPFGQLLAASVLIIKRDSLRNLA